MNFKEWVQQDIKVLIIAANGESYGAHGRNLEDDIPASNPVNNAEWFILVKPEAEQLLKDKKIQVTVGNYGSYHERWFRLRAYAMLENYDQQEQLLTLQKDNEDFINYSSERENKMTYSFIFSTFADAIRQLHMFAKSTESENAPTDDNAQQFWDRMTQSYLAGRTRHTYEPYNPKDSYWKKK